MRKKLLFLATAVMLSLSVWAETPQECFTKHPTGQSFFCKTPASSSTLDYPLDIERVTFDIPKGRVYILTEQADEELVKEIQVPLCNDGKSIVFLLTDGSLIAVSDEGILTYVVSGDDGGIATKIDVDKTTEVNKLCEAKTHRKSGKTRKSRRN